MKIRVQTVNRLHREAMEYGDRSFTARRHGNRETYLRFTKLAFEKEAAAAELLKEPANSFEPTRAILHRSAATLAWRCEMHDEAKRLIYRGLEGNPPADIKWELEDLLAKVEAALEDAAPVPQPEPAPAT